MATDVTFVGTKSGLLKHDVSVTNTLHGIYLYIYIEQYHNKPVPLTNFPVLHHFRETRKTETHLVIKLYRYIYF